MDATRRDALAIATAPFLLAAAPAAGPPAGPPGAVRILRIFAGADGISHGERVALAAPAKPLPVASVLAAGFGPAVEDWHHAPFKTFTINLAGRIEAETSDGERHAIGPGDLVYLEDFTGRGHLTRLLTPGASLYLRMADDFDLLAWARG